MIWDNFSIFRTNRAILTSYIRPKSFRGFRETGPWALTCSCMPRSYWKRWVFSGSKTISRCDHWMNTICSHSQVERVSFCLCSRKVVKKNCLFWYRVNLRISQTMPNHNQNLFLIVCYSSVFFLHWWVCKSFWVAHLYSAARALSTPNFNCQQILTKISFLVFCAEMLPLTPKGC